MCVRIALQTISTILRSLDLHRRRFIDPNGETNRKPQIVDNDPFKWCMSTSRKFGRILDGAGWRAHGRWSERAETIPAPKSKNKQARTLHFVIDGITRTACSEARDR